VGCNAAQIALGALKWKKKNKKIQPLSQTYVSPPRASAGQMRAEHRA